LHSPFPLFLAACLFACLFVGGYTIAKKCPESTHKAKIKNFKKRKKRKKKRKKNKKNLKTVGEF